MSLPAHTRNVLKRGMIVLAVLPLLSGCVAAVAIPLVAGGVLKARDQVRVRAATRLAKNSPQVSNPTVTVTSLTELPPPDGAVAPNGSTSATWQPFVDYALAHATAAKEAPGPSALLVTGGSMATPQREKCLAPHPAVVIDLDEGKTTFDPAKAQAAPAGLAASLVRLREAGVVVLWISQLPAARVADVSHALAASGLDPDRRDQLLLIRNPEDRKQVLRLQANADVCIVAIAGDRRDDFDELFDYLRTPDAALGLSLMIQTGWFLVPAPFGTTPPEQ
jgi:hypothetical protein